MFAPDTTITSAIEVVSLRGKNGNIDNLERLLMNIGPRTYDLVIIDPLYKCYPDPFDENSNAQMTVLFRRFERIAEHLDAALLIVHHGTKGSQAEKRVVDVGTGASAQSRSADCHITLREHEQPDAVVLDARVRSFPPVDSIVLRWDYPLWHRDLTLNPDDLKTSRRPRNSDAAQSQPKAKPEPWTPERFVSAFLTDRPKDKKLIIARARAAAVPFNQIDALIALAVDDKIAFGWSFPKDRTTYFANREQTVAEMSDKSLSERDSFGNGVEVNPDSHTHTSPRTPRVRQKSPRRGGTDACGEAMLINLRDVRELRPVTRLLPHTREVVLLVRGHSAHYRVDLDRITDAPSLIGWLEHLLQKRWVTPRHLRELITLVERENGVAVNRGM